jgi:hypothetical protein
MTTTEPLAVTGPTDADRERARAWSSVLTLRVRRALERAGVPIAEVAEATHRSKKDISRRLNPPLLTVDDLDGIGALLGDPACLSLFQPAENVRHAERAVLDAVRDWVDADGPARAMEDAYIRLATARVEVGHP